MRTEWRWLKVPRRLSWPLRRTGIAFFHQAAEGQRFGHAVVDRALAIAHLGALFEKLLHLGMNVEIRGIRGQPIGEFGNFFRGKRGFHFVLAVCSGRRNSCPNISADRAGAAFFEPTCALLGGFQFRFDRVDACLHVVGADVFGVNLPQRRMFFDRFVQQRLGDGGVVDFAVAVTAVADQIDDDIGAKLVAIFQRRCERRAQRHRHLRR